MPRRHNTTSEPVVELRIRQLLVDPACDGARASDLGPTLREQVRSLWTGALPAPGGAALVSPLAQAIVGELRTQVRQVRELPAASPARGSGHGSV